MPISSTTKWFNYLSIRKKFFLLTTTTFVFLLSLSIIMVVYINNITDSGNVFTNAYQYASDVDIKYNLLLNKLENDVDTYYSTNSLQYYTESLNDIDSLYSDSASSINDIKTNSLQFANIFESSLQNINTFQTTLQQLKKELIDSQSIQTDKNTSIQRTQTLIEQLNYSHLQVTISNKSALEKYVSWRDQASVRIVLIGSLIFVFILIIQSFSTNYIIKLIVKPIEQLTKAVSKIHSGNWESTVSIEQNDELGTLANAFNQMLANLRQMKSSLLISAEIEKRQRLRYEAILLSIGDGVFVLDDQRKILLVNDAALKIAHLEIAPANIIGLDYLQFFDFRKEADSSIAKDFIDRVYLTGKTSSMQNHTILLTKNGLKVPVSDSAAPIKDINNQISGCVVVFRDITREREIIKMKDEFISIASHQLRTPLTAIRWITERFLKTYNSQTSPEQKEMIYDLRFSTKRLIDLVGDLLNITRIESGRIVVEPTLTSVAEMIKSIIVEVQNSIDEKHTQIHLESLDTPLINLDPKLMRQVFLNIITNSIKYSPINGHIYISSNIENSQLIITIKDTGLGIPENEKANIFQKFFRASNVATMYPDSTGLGLYLVKQIMQVIEGKVWFDSTENVGTTFYVSMPLKGISPKSGEVTIT